MRRGALTLPEFPGAEMLYDAQDRVIGVRTAIKELIRREPKPNFEPALTYTPK